MTESYQLTGCHLVIFGADAVQSAQVDVNAVLSALVHKTSYILEVVS